MTENPTASSLRVTFSPAATLAWERPNILKSFTIVSGEKTNDRLCKYKRLKIKLFTIVSGEKANYYRLCKC